MGKGRLEAFSDGVIAIIITITILLIDVPQGDDLTALADMLPLVSAYILLLAMASVYSDQSRFGISFADWAYNAMKGTVENYELDLLDKVYKKTE